MFNPDIVWLVLAVGIAFVWLLVGAVGMALTSRGKR